MNIEVVDSVVLCGTVTQDSLSGVFYYVSLRSIKALSIRLV